MKRKSKIARKTGETSIKLELDLDGSGKSDIRIEPGFWKHMLTLFSFFGNFDLKLDAKGDRDVDDHHLIEDVGICLGDAFKKALGEKKGIKRYGSILVPMDETLVQIALDISGRPYLAFNIPMVRNWENYSLLENAQEFFRAFANHAGLTIHLQLLSGENLHHIIEALFKGFAVAMKDAVTVSGGKVSSTKGKFD